MFLVLIFLAAVLTGGRANALMAMGKSLNCLL